MTEIDSDSDEARTPRARQAAAYKYRIAFGPHAGQKVLMLWDTMPREQDFKQILCADINGSTSAPPYAARPATGRRWSNCSAASSGADQRGGIVCDCFGE